MTANWLIVLNWNGRDDTLELLDTLRAADLPDTTVLVVDNASSDSTLEAVSEQHPWVQTLQTGSNLGYAGGNNRGIELALAEGAEVIGVLNNDTLVEPDFWAPLVAAARNESTAVSPDIRYAADPDTSWFFGSCLSQVAGTVRHLQPGEQPSRDRQQESETLTGCCLVASAATWRRVGLFDEGMFLIFEDADWSLRARDRGVRLLLEPRSVVRHKVSRSFQGSQAGVGLYYYCRNGTTFAARWLGPRATLNFVHRSVLRESARQIGRKGLAGCRSAVLRGLAAAQATGTRGKAGPMIERLANARRPSFTDKVRAG